MKQALLIAVALSLAGCATDEFSVGTVTSTPRRLRPCATAWGTQRAVSACSAWAAPRPIYKVGGALPKRAA